MPTRRVSPPTRRHAQLARVRDIVTAPGPLESSCLAVAWGADVFAVQHAPSGSFDRMPEEFNYGMLVLLVSGVAAVSVVSHFMARRKALKEKWQ